MYDYLSSNLDELRSQKRKGNLPGVMFRGKVLNPSLPRKNLGEDEKDFDELIQKFNSRYAPLLLVGIDVNGNAWKRRVR